MDFKKTLISLATAALVATTFTACGLGDDDDDGASSSSSSSSAAVKQGRLVSPFAEAVASSSVSSSSSSEAAAGPLPRATGTLGWEGVAYDCGTGYTGTTGANGTFDYVEGATCTFTLGSVALGSTDAQENVTVGALAGGSDTKAVNIARIAAYVDADGDTSNGIQTSSEKSGKISADTNLEDMNLGDIDGDGVDDLISYDEAKSACGDNCSAPASSSSSTSSAGPLPSSSSSSISFSSDSSSSMTSSSSSTTSSSSSSSSSSDAATGTASLLEVDSQGIPATGGMTMDATVADGNVVIAYSASVADAKYGASADATDTAATVDGSTVTVPSTAAYVKITDTDFNSHIFEITITEEPASSSSESSSSESSSSATSGVTTPDTYTSPSDATFESATVDGATVTAPAADYLQIVDTDFNSKYFEVSSDGTLLEVDSQGIPATGGETLTYSVNADSMMVVEYSAQVQAAKYSK